MQNTDFLFAGDEGYDQLVANIAGQLADGIAARVEGDPTPYDLAAIQPR